jgi:Ca2+-transporting ATPase
MTWLDKPIEETVQGLYADVQNGLSEADAADRLEKYGSNELTAKKSKSFIERFIDQLKDFMIIILILASIISAIITVLEGEYSFVDPIVIIFIVLLNAVLGVVQESKAEKALDALKNMSSPNAKVIRDGKINSIKSSELVLGDIVLIEAGDFIPADGRIIESASLRVEESALTGEALPVEKNADFFATSSTPLAERKNMVYATSSVVYGRGRILITETGMNTEVGKIADMLQNEGENMTPLQTRLAQLGKYLGIIALSICAIIFIVGIIEGEPIPKMFLIAVSLAVAAIPEGLPAIVTIVLAIGVQQMVKKHAIIRRLPAVETLGSASVICSDKTGTLTQNRMTVVKAYINGNIFDMSHQRDENIANLLRLGALCCDGRVEIVGGEEKHFGDPTETAIVAVALRYQLANLNEKYPRLGEIPFDSDRKMMTTIHNIDGRIIAIVKGAPDMLFKKCKDNTDKAAEANGLLAKDALRVLAVAYKELPEFPTEIIENQIENNLRFVGLIGMIDPPRDEAKIAVETCKNADIRTVMITGDNIITASAIAKQLGILDENSSAMTGAELSNMSDKELYENISKYSVFARVSPQDKIRIVKAWQHNGQVVAMTGDGVNDAPALKGADIGCAMGITGTDVAKGAADMVLTDDNFATIVLAVREGRGIYNNILKTIQFLLGSNISEVLTVFMCMITGLGAPLAAIQILWINLVTDGLPALALGMEPIEKDVMDEKPRPKSDSIFSNGVGLRIAMHGLMLGILAIAGYCLGYYEMIPLPEGTPQFLYGQKINYVVAQTMAFGVIAFSQTFHAFNLRSKSSLLKVGVFKNKFMLGAIAISSALLLGVMLIPPLATVFKVAPLGLIHWAAIIGLSFSTIIIIEISKLFSYKFKH